MSSTSAVVRTTSSVSSFTTSLKVLLAELFFSRPGVFLGFLAVKNLPCLVRSACRNPSLGKPRENGYAAWVHLLARGQNHAEARKYVPHKSGEHHHPRIYQKRH